MKTHLIQPRELFGPEERRAELRECWLRNMDLFDDYTHPEGRPTFSELFAMCKPDHVNFIANSDIYFDGFGIRVAADSIWCGLIYALSRHDVDAQGNATLWDHLDSQDAWIIEGGPYEIDAPFAMGVAGCDNALVHILERQGFEVLNPSRTIAAYHLHNVQWRSYLVNPDGTARGGNKIERVPPPYGFAKPTHL
jgi:hypothetical protein